MSIGGLDNLPAMSTSAYSSQSYAGAQMLGNALFLSGAQAQNQAAAQDLVANETVNAALLRRIVANQQQEKKQMSRRIIQVYIADPNENVPLEDAILYTGEQKMTDATDQEFFFEIDMRGVLEKHNAKRIKIADKKVKDRTEYLEPAKVRDLKMVVVTVASF